MLPLSISLIWFSDRSKNTSFRRCNKFSIHFILLFASVTKVSFVKHSKFSIFSIIFWKKAKNGRACHLIINEESSKTYIKTNTYIISFWCTLYLVHTIIKILVMVIHVLHLKQGTLCDEDTIFVKFLWKWIWYLGPILFIKYFVIVWPCYKYKMWMK